MAATAVAEAVEGHGLPSLGPVRTNARALPAEPPTPLARERARTCHDGRDGLSPAYQRPRGAPFGGVASADPRMAAQARKSASRSAASGVSTRLDAGASPTPSREPGRVNPSGDAREPRAAVGGGSLRERIPAASGLGKR